MDSSNKSNSDDSEDDNSDDKLKIVLDSPNKRRRFVPNESDKQIIKEVEDKLEESLDQKAAKSNLKTNHVKNILKHVVTNEHVLALVRQAENPEDNDESITVYEPKLTRAKAKELLSNVPHSLLVKTKQSSESETHVLFSADLQEEDSSGDEYVPGEEESEDDRDSSVISDSDPLSVPPMTPPTPLSNDTSTQTNWTDDGVFKIPPTIIKTEEDANIALRTRSKLCLSSTPLEIIEEQFIPPDITTDMYDMDCDDEDWTDFLKKFTRPLDEVTKGAEDEDHDPEYNILADEQIDEVDKEELRVDKAVKVSRKELNNLMAELFEFANIEFEKETDKSRSIITPDPQISELSLYANKSKLVEEDPKDIMIEKDQIPLLEQQLRQHVQLLTQNFILSYQHPEFHEQSLKLKEYLFNLKFLSEGKMTSIFYILNLESAIKIVNDWETLISSNTNSVQDMKRHMEKDIAESLRRKNCGYYDYVYTMPPLILETISRSDVFLYTSLLPRLPFKSSNYFSSKSADFADSEDSLLALALEQFVALAADTKELQTRSGDVSLKMVCKMIQEHVVPTKDHTKIYNHVLHCREPRCASNPIKYYFQTKKAPPLMHYVYPLSQLKVLPPCERRPEELPHQIRNYLFRVSDYGRQMDWNSSLGSATLTPIVGLIRPHSLITNRTILPQVCHSFYVNKSTKPPRRPVITSTPLRTKSNRSKKRRLNPRTDAPRKSRVLTPLDNFVQILRKPSPSSKIFDLFPKVSKQSLGCSGSRFSPQNLTMLPSMPNLSTPIKKPDGANATSDEDLGATRRNILKGLAEELKIESSVIENVSNGTKNVNCDIKNEVVDAGNEEKKDETVTNENTSSDIKSVDVGPSSSESSDLNNTTSEKDNLDDINALMIASSTVKLNTKKEPSGAEKKRAKIRREFLANMAICAPEDPELETQKSEMFAMAYYDKLRETLELEHYHKIMQILNDHESGDAVDLYREVEGVLRPKYADLADEFLLFLRDREAAAAGRLVPWIQMTARSKFLRKLEVYFKDQPAQLRKIFKCLTELAESVDVTMDRVKSTLIPMLKGNSVLIEMFLQNFLSETPPKSLMEGAFENIDIHKEMSRPDDEELCENIVIPEEYDVYGGNMCICSCHKIEDPEFKTRHRHCIPCGTKFIQGKVYIQSGRGPRPATVSFLTNTNKDHNIRLNGKSSSVSSRRKRSDTSPSKQVNVSPSKDNGDEESEDDGDGKKKAKAKTARKRKKQPDKKAAKEPQKGARGAKNCDRGKTERREKPARKRLAAKKAPKEVKVEATVKVEVEEDEAGVKAEEDGAETKPGSAAGQCKRLAEEPVEWEDCGASIESVEVKPSSPGTQTAESESEFCEESSQDNCESDSNSSVSSTSNAHSQSDSNAGEELHWRRDEDKIILETFQKENDKEHAFSLIAKKLTNRTVAQIRSRFQTLMTLLMEQLR